VRKVLVPSEYVKQKVIERLGVKEVTVTPNGIDHAIFHPGARQRIEMPGRYVLFVGTLEPRKNLNVLLDAWDKLSADFKDTWLVIAGASGEVFRSVNLSPDRERVCFPGYLDDEALAGLYANASLFVLPSREEGFGLPALEAMACGAPVLVSDGGALPEVVGEAAVIFSLSEPSGLRDALKTCLSDADLRLRLKEQGLERAREFSWPTTAELVWKSLNEI
jgi:glycosyltransferase involved in cell wall biosynthesis